MRSTDAGVTWSAVAETASYDVVAYGNDVFVGLYGVAFVIRKSIDSSSYKVTGTNTTSATSITMTYNELYLGL